MASYSQRRVVGTQRRGPPACLVGDCAGGQIGICWAFGTQGGTSQAGRDVCACVCLSICLTEEYFHGGYYLSKDPVTGEAEHRFK